VYDNDTADILQERILKEEHRIYSQAIQFYAEGRLEINGRKVQIKDSGTMETPRVHNPPLEKF
jgi:phosphoribosylglycinamide formyltransferase-1